MDTDRQSLLIYDGSCSFCTSRANALSRSSCEGLTLLSSSSIDDQMRERLGIGDEALDRYVLFIDQTGQRYRGALAIGRAMCAAGGWRAVIGASLSYPPIRTIAALLYAAISRVRRHVPG